MFSEKLNLLSNLSKAIWVYCASHTTPKVIYVFNVWNFSQKRECVCDCVSTQAHMHTCTHSHRHKSIYEERGLVNGVYYSFTGSHVTLWLWYHVNDVSCLDSSVTAEPAPLTGDSQELSFTTVATSEIQHSVLWKGVNILHQHDST